MWSGEFLVVTVSVNHCRHLLAHSTVQEGIFAAQVFCLRNTALVCSLPGSVVPHRPGVSGTKNQICLSLCAWRFAFRAPASPLGTVPAQHQHPLSLEGSWWCFGQKRCSRGRGCIAALSPAAHPLCPPFTLFFCRLRAWRCARNAAETPSPHFVSRL